MVYICKEQYNCMLSLEHSAFILLGQQKTILWTNLLATLNAAEVSPSTAPCHQKLLLDPTRGREAKSTLSPWCAGLVTSLKGGKLRLVYQTRERSLLWAVREAGELLLLCDNIMAQWKGAAAHLASPNTKELQINNFCCKKSAFTTRLDTGSNILCLSHWCAIM